MYVCMYILRNLFNIGGREGREKKKKPSLADYMQMGCVGDNAKKQLVPFKQFCNSHTCGQLWRSCVLPEKQGGEGNPDRGAVICVEHKRVNVPLLGQSNNDRHFYALSYLCRRWLLLLMLLVKIRPW